MSEVKLEEEKPGLDIKITDDNAKGEIRTTVHLYGKPDEPDDIVRIRAVDQWRKVKNDLKVKVE